MKNDLFNTEIDEIIRASMKMADEPAPELNNKLKATLYQKEAAMRKQPATFICLTLLLVSVSTLDWLAFCLP